MKVRLIFLAGLAVPGLLVAQFKNLVAPGDGASVYFSSNLPLRPFSSGYLLPGLPPQRWILTAGDQPLSLVAGLPVPDLPDLPPPSGENIQYVTDYYSLERYDVSRDRSVAAITARRVCIGGGACINDPLYRTTVRGAPGGENRVFDGEGWLSRNGRYLLSGRPGQFSPPVTVVDLYTGQQTDFDDIGAGPFTASGRAVADNGAAVVASDSIYVVRVGQRRRLPPTDALNAAEPVIDAEGQIIVYSARLFSNPNRQQLRLYRLATNQDAVFLQGNGDVYAPAVSADGNKVMFLSTVQFGTKNPPGTPQLYTVNLDGTGFQPLTSASEPSGVLSYTMSDDGTVAWYVSGLGRLVKLNLATDTTEEKIPNTPQAVFMPSYISRGSATSLGAIAMSAENLQVKVDNLTAPILAENPGKILVQVPWGIPVLSDLNLPSGFGQTVRIDVETGVQSPFDTNFHGSARVRDFLPDLDTPPIHEDWSGFVSDDSPAQAGEVISFYATGLGPVVPTASTGVPGPSDPPAVIITPLSCNATALYAGLAPGLIGYYQVSVLLPAVIMRSSFDLSCSLGYFGLRSEIPVK